MIRRIPTATMCGLRASHSAPPTRRARSRRTASPQSPRTGRRPPAGRSSRPSIATVSSWYAPMDLSPHPIRLSSANCSTEMARRTPASASSWYPSQRSTSPPVEPMTRPTRSARQSSVMTSRVEVGRFERDPISSAEAGDRFSWRVVVPQTTDSPRESGRTCNDSARLSV